MAVGKTMCSPQRWQAPLDSEWSDSFFLSGRKEKGVQPAQRLPCKEFIVLQKNPPSLAKHPAHPLKPFRRLNQFRTHNSTKH